VKFGRFGVSARFYLIGNGKVVTHLGRAGLAADEGRPNILDATRDGQIALVIATGSTGEYEGDARIIRRTALESQVPYLLVRELSLRESIVTLSRPMRRTNKNRRIEVAIFLSDVEIEVITHLTERLISQRRLSSSRSFGATARLVFTIESECVRLFT
jgi:hypothetical protein